MKSIININKYLHLLLGLCFLLSGCADDLDTGLSPDDNGTILSLTVDDFFVNSDVTRATEPEIANESEKRINNIWVFQYDGNGNKLAEAIYYIVNDQKELEELKNIKLVSNISSTICVVANINDANWGKGSGFNTLEGLKNQVLPSPEPIMEADLQTIPMFGTVTMKVTVASRVKVKMTRMFAKVKISFGFLAEGLSAKSIEISSIPNYCRVNSMSDGLEEKDAANYLESTSWITRAFNADASSGGQVKKEYVIYIPENIQGETESKTEKEKSEKVPSKALVVNLIMLYKDADTYEDKELKNTIYPGGNNYNNFNIKRNCVYRIKVNINDPDQLHTPSSNCFVVVPGRTLSFEPYYRTEKGGGYNFSDYCNPNDVSKKIESVGIIWQTFDAIGDNSKGDLVTFEYNEKEPIYSKIKVRTKKEGNALIAGYNANKEIVWSWHIWITANDPGNVGEAIVYYTYAWDKNGIKYNANRIEGYAVMPCNLGALANDPTDTGNTNTANNWYCKTSRTYGMLYQWGRKDPFPPMKKRTSKAGGFYNYDNTVVQVFNNSNTLITMTTDGYVSSKNELFNTVLASDSKIGKTFQSGINFSIKNPTIHISSAKQALTTATYNDPSYYINKGNWLPVEDQKLWGGITVNSNTEKYLAYDVNATDKRAIWRNYGPDKTIFDPCPKGWRVPPGDLWLGFTSDGINKPLTTTEHRKNINIPDSWSIDNLITYNGFWICLNGWKTSSKSTQTFFPTPGSRLASGQPLHGDICGNYHNATTDPANTTVQRVNILHFHSASGGSKINIFEDQLLYYNKGVAGPVRCVRDTK